MTDNRERIRNLIGGDLRIPASGNFIDNFDPATGKVYSLTPDSDAADLAAAVRAARTAFPGWSTTPTETRSRCLQRIADLIEKHTDELAHAESVDSGKPVSLARAVEIPRAQANFRFFAGAATQFFSESHAMEVGAVNYTLRQPHGIVACISPWNLPLYLLTWKIAPALAAGNCVIAKPSEITPMTAYLLSRLSIEAGLPRGVLNILHGSGPGIGQAIVEHPEVPAISFTGGTRTGAGIAATAGPMFKKLTLELGGKNPNIVFADCDWDTMMPTSVQAAFRNQGEICLCGSRILIERPVYDRFRDEFVARTKARIVGDPLLEETEHGAMVSRPHMEKVLGYVELARKEGGQVLCGGERMNIEGRCSDGWFIAPTVIDGLPANCRTNQEEIFGPIATLIPFDSEDEALEIANGTPYGLAASIWSRDVSRCHRMAAAVESGVIWVNTWMLRDLRTPMGGMKQSGVGREGGFEILRFFTEPKNVCIRYGEQN
ncbi:MAG: aldehyde dehydrogenase [Gammaproteobacteria bacterium]